MEDGETVSQRRATLHGRKAFLEQLSKGVEVDTADAKQELAYH